MRERRRTRRSVRRLLVRLEAGALREALPAQRALEGFLPAVDHGVADEVALLGEAAAALHAAVRLLARVAPQVLLQLAEAQEGLVAVRAAEALLAQAGPPGRPRPPGRAQAAAALPAEGGGGGVRRGRRLLLGVSARRLGLWSDQAAGHGVDPRENAVSFVRLFLTRKRFRPPLRLRRAQKHGVGFHHRVDLSHHLVQRQAGVRREHRRDLLGLLPRVRDPRVVSVQAGRPQRRFGLLRHKRVA